MEAGSMIEAIEQASVSQVAAHRARLDRMARLNPIAARPVPMPIAIVARPVSHTVPALQCTSWPEWVIEIAHGGSTQPRRAQLYPPIRDIIEVVAEFYSVRPLDILSARRTFEIVRPRQIAAYLAKTMTPKSLPEVGRNFGGRDHSTILHAVRKIARLLESDIQLADECKAIQALIMERMSARS
jgi:hypothetical protein